MTNADLVWRLVELLHKKEKDFPFLESLLELLYLDIWKYEPLFKDMERVIREIYREDDYSYQARLSGLLDELAQVHIFFNRHAWIGNIG